MIHRNKFKTSWYHRLGYWLHEQLEKLVALLAGFVFVLFGLGTIFTTILLWLAVACMPILIVVALLVFIFR